MRADRMTATEPSAPRPSRLHRLFEWRARRLTSESEQRLESALRQPACPLCAAETGSDSGWLERFLREGYQIREVLEQVAEDCGFCSRHGERLARFEDHSGTIAHVHAAILRRALDDLDRSRGRPRTLTLACRACAHELEISRGQSFFFVRTLWRLGVERYGDPATLCSRHLAATLGSVNRRTLEAMLSTHAEWLGSYRTAAATRPSASPAQRIDRAGEHDASGDLESAKERTIRILGGPRGPARRVDGAEDRGSRIHDPIARLRARLADGPCAICAEMQHLQRHWIRWLDAQSGGGESIEDILPVCRDHVWDAIHDGGPALQRRLAEAVLQRELARIRHAWRTLTSARVPALCAPITLARPIRGGVPPSVIDMLTRAPRCPLCDALDAARRRTVELLGILLCESAVREALERGPGLCARHALQAAGTLGQHGRTALAGAMRVKFEIMIWELDELLRRSAWGARAEPAGAEEPPWRRAVLLVSGRMT